ncbi:NAD(P)-dependent iron-only hydrogenase iron-sulfur protein [Natronincola peptidivorans]|uniref:NAD(P)-dependent iron-only hydrogenase iron-sulfur protein n=1 Tax=Natronincola peptidivorans TaxID=426128 RepID=A0A1I0A3B9_9FIRM|nr:(2Fe-2S) ferredoxin domain-containing protein [Natronincola peptidivorans]SES88465.1 NAD(P)-dependent iron-only hydrogenase iron-sulfur protein [Natronincola peptidivorans]
MKQIKSLEELKRIRDNANQGLNIRKAEEEKHIKLKVGMATCGIAAGARETFNTLFETIEKKGLKDVYLVQVGCMGYCHDEPMVQVNVPGESPILYGKVDKEKAKEIIEKHVEKGELLQDSIISKSFHKE